MPEYLAPGVYVERPDAARPAAAPRTDVAALVGYAERGPLHAPMRVESWRQYAAAFGEFAAPGYLPLAVRGFFDNGGRTCHVVRVADRGAAAPAAAVLPGSGWVVEASSPGRWGNRLAVAVRTARAAQTTAAPDAAGGHSATRVASVARFEPFALARLTQRQGATVVVAVAVVGGVDGERQRLVWAAPLDPAIDPTAAFTVECLTFTLVVTRDGRAAAQVEGLSAVEGHVRYAPRVLADRAARPGPPQPPPLVVVRSVRPVAAVADLPADADPVFLAGGDDGLASVRVEDFTGAPEDELDLDAAGRPRLRGLRALESVDEVALVAVPDVFARPPRPVRYAPPPPPPPPDPCACAPPPPADPPAPQPVPEAADLPPSFDDAAAFRVQAAVVAHCEAMGDRFGLLAVPPEAARPAAGHQAALAWRARFDTTFAALYHPWLTVADPATGLPTDVPPCGAVAGVIARTDLEVGVHRAPANLPVRGAVAPTTEIDAAAHGVFNPRGVNVLRSAPGRGVLVAGARTLGSDPDLRFVNVRRLLLMIEKAAGLAARWAVFEPNSFATRARLRLVLESFLAALWRRGALAGAQPEEAYFVRCDEATSPAEARANGRLVAEVGVAPAIPGEFVVVRIGRAADEAVAAAD